MLSHSPADFDPNADQAAYVKAFDQLEWMLAEGAGLSGKERNVFFLNTQEGRFADASAASGLDFPDDARACGPVDWDGDGDLDLWVVNRNAPQVRYLRNDTERANHWLEFDLLGTAPNTSRDAIGARVEVRLSGDPRPLLRTLRAGEGYLSQASRTVHFGLGAASAIERLTVRWPGGATEAFSGATADGRFRLVQGAGKAEPTAVRPAEPELAARSLPNPKKSGKSRSFLSTRMPFPRIAWTDAKGARRTLDAPNGRPQLVVVWTSWCCQCEDELGALAAARSALQTAGLRITALSIDECDDHPAGREEALAVAQARQFIWPVGFLDRQGVDQLRGFYSALYTLHPPLPTPVSFLLDGNGRLACFYKGAVDLAELQRDLNLVNAPAGRLLELALPFGGSRYSSPEPTTVLQFTERLLTVAGGAIAGDYLDACSAEQRLTGNREALTDLHLLRLRIARERRDAKEFAAARRQLTAALAEMPTSPIAHLRMGELSLLEGDAEGASGWLARAVELDAALAEQAARLRRGDAADGSSAGAGERGR